MWRTRHIESDGDRQGLQPTAEFIETSRLLTSIFLRLWFIDDVKICPYAAVRAEEKQRALLRLNPDERRQRPSAYVPGSRLSLMLSTRLCGSRRIAPSCHAIQ